MAQTKLGNLFIGSAMYAVFGLFGSVAMGVYARNNTKDPSMRGTNQW